MYSSAQLEHVKPRTSCGRSYSSLLRIPICDNTTRWRWYSFRAKKSPEEIAPNNHSPRDSYRILLWSDTRKSRRYQTHVEKFPKHDHPLGNWETTRLQYSAHPSTDISPRGISAGIKPRYKRFSTISSGKPGHHAVELTDQSLDREDRPPQDISI